MTDPRLLSFFPQRPEHEQHQPAAAQHLPTPALPGGAVSMERPHAEPGVGMCWRVPGAQAATPRVAAGATGWGGRRLGAGGG